MDYLNLPREEAIRKNYRACRSGIMVKIENLGSLHGINATGKWTDITLHNVFTGRKINIKYEQEWPMTELQKAHKYNDRYTVKEVLRSGELGETLHVAYSGLPYDKQNLYLFVGSLILQPNNI